MTPIHRTTPGFYGKVPMLGDFVTRRLPQGFVSAWDDWLQSAIAASREELGAAWLDIYLTSPIWRFGLSSGLCGASAWLGVMMPSVDRVGRYFPLTVAAPLEKPGNLPFVFSRASQWFAELESAALRSLSDGFELETLDRHLKTLRLPEAAMIDLRAERPAETTGKLAFQCSVDDIEHIESAFVGVSAGMLEQFMPGYSLWSTGGSERISPSLLVCEGLPSVTAYSALLNGDWQTRGWRIRCQQLPRDAAHKIPQVPPAPEERAESVLVTPAASFRPAARPPLGRNWRSCGRTEVGRRRKFNEDAILNRPEDRLWAVADGMGGHEAGDVASRKVVEALARLRPVRSLEAYLQQLCDCLREANRELRILAAERSCNGIIGSTVVALIAEGDRCAFVWAGDSRLYRLRDGRLTQLTRDHCDDETNLEEFFVDPGLMPSKASNVITRAVGAADLLELDSEIRQVQAGDVFLLCSDGLDKEVAPGEIEAILSANRQAPEDSVDRLMELALARGARDNVSVVVVCA